MTHHPTPWLLAAGAAFALAFAPAVRAETRGELLYATHCIACHSSQVHWRDKKLATDWRSLTAQVRRWQANAALGWSDDDILQVAQHLNERYYLFPRPVAQLSR